MIKMNQIQQMREDYYAHGKSLTEIAADMSVDWRTVRKYIDKNDFNAKQDSLKDKEPTFPKLEAYKPMIDKWLEADKKAPRKQRHTAVRVYKRLCDEYKGFDCSLRLVTEYVKLKKKSLYTANTDAHIPLEHRPGEAQGDFGTSDFVENGVQVTGKYFVYADLPR